MLARISRVAPILALTFSQFACVAAADDAETAPDEDPGAEESSVAAGCPTTARIFTYNPRGWAHLADAFAANPSPCAEYYIHLPALANNKTKPRAAVEGIHARGPHFHALAEFHWGEWAKVTSMTWYERGVEFRKRMLAAGYDPKRDSWSINELPSSVRTSDEVRAHVRALVRGLYEGPPGSPKNAGLVYVIAMGTKTENMSVYKPAMKDWTLDAEFWQQMDLHVRWWAQEVYTDPHNVCVGGTTVAEKAEHINDFVMHPARLAVAGPAGANPAQGFFNQGYVPLMNAFWHGDAYGTTTIGLTNMKHLVSTQVYAARAWATDHAYPDWRIGLAWNEQLEGATEPELAELAKRTASAIRWAYNTGGTGAARACSPSGAYTWCQCNIAGAEFNETWKQFATW